MPDPKPWIEVVEPHRDVLSDDFSEEIFALDLGALADGGEKVPPVYRKAEDFFRASYLTKGLKSLLQDVLSRLSGEPGNRVLKLVTPFGGGKSHTLAALYHAARDRKALDVIPEGKEIPRPKGKIRTAVFDGQFFDAVNGKQVPGEGFRVKTLWGWIAWSLGGKKGYEILRKQDEERVAPGGDEILALLSEGPNLILLDEVLNYLVSAAGVSVQQTTLLAQTEAFLQRLTTAVGNAKDTVLVFSLQASQQEALQHAALLNTVNHLAARKDQTREPVDGEEVMYVIQRRLLAKAPDERQATQAALAYQNVRIQMRRALAQTPAEEREAEEEGSAFQDRVRGAYPFHPALIDLMRERWAAIPDFQRTRGALRFLAACLRAAHKEGKSRAVLGPGDVPMQNADVKLAFFKEVGQQSDFQAVLEHDLTGVNARAKRIDARRAKETPADATKHPAVRLATAILMFSFGGRRRDGAQGADALPPGVTESELLAACVGPDLDSTTAKACLKDLREQCLYIHYDGTTYCFKKDPNVTLLVEQEVDGVSEGRVRERIKELLEERLAGHDEAVLWPEQSSDVPDKEPAFLIAYLPLEYATKSKAQREETAREILEKHGERPRQYKNGLGLAVPDRQQVEALRRSVRYHIAIKQVQDKALRHNLISAQKSQLREREATAMNELEASFLRLYTEILLPNLAGGSLALESVSAGARPLQATYSEGRRAMVHQRVMELLTGLQKKVFDSVHPGKIVELFKLGDGKPPRLGVKASEVVDGFYSFPGFPRLVRAQVCRKAIARGVGEGLFGYTSGATPALGLDGTYQIPLSKVRHGLSVAEDEVDLETGFLMMPQSIPRPVATPPGGATVAVGAGVGAGPAGPQPGPTPTTGTGMALAPQKSVELTFRADRDKLYAAWPAVANLADQAGTVEITLRASSDKGFDKAKLQNGVIEPLREQDLIE